MRDRSARAESGGQEVGREVGRREARGRPVEAGLLGLQRTLGNRGVTALVGRVGGEGDPFAGLPANAVAVHRERGVFMTVPGGVGSVVGMGDPEFFSTGDGAPRGSVELGGVASTAEVVCYGTIGNKTGGPRIPSTSYLIAWYLTRYGHARLFEVRTVASEVLSGQLWNLGMRNDPQALNDMVGDRVAVLAAATRQCAAHGWTLRD
ncbi:MULTISPECIES: hypothetical protein [Actinosynnema]|uniref:hypothetical protein n=1 Tax=Actinosynnema TaxID=40566 RepID=UPI0020A4955B|nr:hypothetical protein [Actinosynnema pretiosum]MCP2092242.1 hypothetical protein [Actinosynnema pretiosum]